MRSKVYTIVASAGGTTYSPAYPIDTYCDPTNIGVGVDIIYGTTSALYDVQHTFDDPGVINLNANPTGNSITTGIWHNNSTLTSANTNGDTNYAFPPRAIRFALRAAASASIRGTIVQAGPR